MPLLPYRWLVPSFFNFKEHIFQNIFSFRRTPYLEKLSIATLCVECWVLFHQQRSVTADVASHYSDIIRNKLIMAAKRKEPGCIYNLGSLLVGSWVIECMTQVDFLMCSKWLVGPSVTVLGTSGEWLLSGLPVCCSLLVGRSQAFAISTGTEGRGSLLGEERSLQRRRRGFRYLFSCAHLWHAPAKFRFQQRKKKALNSI